MFNLHYQMQFKPQRRQHQLFGLDNYSEEEVELMNSRKRLNCEASERSSKLEEDNDDEINQFKREIQERFKLSIANKIYTFPKVILSISDIISSSQEEDDSDEEYAYPPKYIKSEKEETAKNFKKKTSDKKIQAKAKLNDSSTKYFQSAVRGAESSKKQRDKLRTNDSTHKRKEFEVKDRDKTYSKVQKQTQIRKQKEKKKGERLKTQPESSVCFLQTIRGKVAKKY